MRHIDYKEQEINLSEGGLITLSEMTKNGFRGCSISTETLFDLVFKYLDSQESSAESSSCIVISGKSAQDNRV